MGLQRWVTGYACLSHLSFAARELGSSPALISYEHQRGCSHARPDREWTRPSPRFHHASTTAKSGGNAQVHRHPPTQLSRDSVNCCTFPFLAVLPTCRRLSELSDASKLHLLPCVPCSLQAHLKKPRTAGMCYTSNRVNLGRQPSFLLPQQQRTHTPLQFAIITQMSRESGGGASMTFPRQIILDFSSRGKLVGLDWSTLQKLMQPHYDASASGCHELYVISSLF
ncbi:hypothetical protein EV356DRAFT_369783 [Viridothelium virens]|uniref:Uncharacterized protein n=1 Tax=Viridothelium virens TaxID=1048519 RepID=A0A6A6GVL9_VIRVR|nr:hypothetical protein EV356DRAFT_369783 [Viridothelium virens]